MACKYIYKDKTYSEKEIYDLIKQGEFDEAFLAMGSSVDITRSVQEGLEILDRLKPFLNELGVTATSFEEYKKSYKSRFNEDIDGYGLADMLNKVIALNEKNITAETVTEEVGHFAIRSLAVSNDFRFSKLMDIIETTDVYKENYDKYMKIYKDEAKVKEEIIGKVLGKSINNTLTKEESSSRIIRLLEYLKQKFLDIFKSKEAKQLRDYIDSITSDVINANLTEFEASDDIFYSVKDARDAKSLLIETRNTLQSKINILKRRQSNEKAQASTEKIFLKVDEYIRKAEYQKGLLEFIELARKDAAAVDAFTVKVEKEGKEMTSLELTYLKTFVDYYKPIVDQIEFLLSRTDEFNFLDDIEKRDAILADLSKDVAMFNRISIFYEIAAKERAKEIIKKVIDDTGSSDNIDLDAIFTEVGADIHVLQQWFGSLKDASDPILRIMHYKVVQAINKTHTQTANFARNIMREADRLGIKDTSWMIEKDDEGNYTPFMLSSYKTKAFKDAYKEFADSINEEFGLSDDPELRKYEIEGMKEFDPKFYKEYAKKWYKWHKDNTREVENAAEIISRRHEELSPSEYKVWYDMNVGVSDTGRTYFKASGELVVPSEQRYGSKTYDSLTKNQKEFLEYVKELKTELDLRLPRGVENGLLPQIRASVADILKSSKKPLADALGLVKSELVRTADDTEFGDTFSAVRPDGSKVNFVPIHFVSRLEDPNLISTDIVSSMIMYSDMVDNFKNMSSIAPEMEIVLEQLKKRKLVTDKDSKSGAETRAAATANKFMEMHMYGKRRENLEVNILGKTINVTKVLNKVASYIRANNLAFNLFTTVSGFMSAATYHKIEQFIGLYVNNKSERNALAIWAKNIHHALLEQGKNLKTNKMQLMFEDHQVVDSRNLFDNIDKSRLTRKAIKSGLYWSYELADYVVKGKLALAIMDNFRYTGSEFLSLRQYQRNNRPADYESKTGKEKGVIDSDLANQYYEMPSYYDMFESKNNKAQVKREYRKIITDDVRNAVINKITTLGSKIDGTLTESDYAAIHQSAWGQFIAMHRGWLFTGLQSRLKKKGFSYMMGETEEGYYRSFANILGFIGKTLLSGERVRVIKHTLNRYNELDEHEKIGIQRTLYEIATVVAFSIIAVIINNLASDSDDDDWAIQYAAYQVNRVLLELAVFVPPATFAELSAVLNSPVAATRQLDTLLDLFDIFSGKEIEAGTYKGLSERTRFLIKMTPILKPAFVTRDPKSANQFLKMKALHWLYH